MSWTFVKRERILVVTETDEGLRGWTGRAGTVWAK